MGIRYTKVTHGILINHLYKFCEALQLLDVMSGPESGVSPDTIIYTSLVDRLCKVCRLEDSLALQNWMSETHECLLDVVCSHLLLSNGCDPDTITYSSLIDGFCKVCKPEDDLALLNPMGDIHRCNPDTITYNSGIDGFYKAGEIYKSLDLVARMEIEGIPPDLFTHNNLISGMSSHSRVGSALNFFHSMQLEWACGIENVVTYTILIGAFLHIGNVDKTMKLFDEMKGDHLQATLLTSP